MCLAVPMRVVSVHNLNASCEARGVRREVSLFLLPADSVAVGDHVLVHVGYAIQTLSKPDAEASWALFDIITADQDAAGQVAVGQVAASQVAASQDWLRA
jgi:hydrogenase expression/formation protein HypC